MGSFETVTSTRRSVRAWAKSRPLKPDDSPLRDGNRDRLLGLLTERAAKTLLFYCSETNQHLYHWLMDYIKKIDPDNTWTQQFEFLCIFAALKEGVELDDPAKAGCFRKIRKYK